MDEINILKQETIKTISRASDLIIKFDNQKDALEISDLLNRTITKNHKDFVDKPDLLNYYNQIITKLKFIALPLLGDNEIVELFKKNITTIFAIDGYDIEEKIKRKMINIVVYEDRDRLKMELKKALLENTETISPQAQIKTIGLWIKDYNYKLGVDIVENIKLVEYFVKLKETQGVNIEIESRIKRILAVYEKLKYSSLSPEGFEEDVPIEIDDKLFIFKSGKMEEIESKKNQDVKNPLHKDDLIINLKPGGIDANRSKPQTEQIETPEQPTPQPPRNTRIDELKDMAGRYPEGSLERRMIEQEIKKLNN